MATSLSLPRNFPSRLGFFAHFQRTFCENGEIEAKPMVKSEIGGKQ